MSDDCIFCKIVAGEIPSRTVYEDDDVFAFLDVNPLSRGHTLVIPKAHHTQLEDMDADLAASLFDAVYDLVGPVQDAVDAPASNVAFNNGPAAGQEVPHVHAHIVPRFEGDGGGPIHAILPDGVDLSDEEFDAVADAIRDAQ